MTWSETPVPEAFLYFTPKKPVPAFKYKVGGGRSELIRGFRGATRNRFFEGVCQFYKQCRELEGAITLLTPAISIYVRSREGMLSQVPLGVGIPLDKVHAVAAVSSEKTCFDGVSTISQDYFIGTGMKEGSALALI